MQCVNQHINTSSNLGIQSHEYSPPRSMAYLLYPTTLLPRSKTVHHSPMAVPFGSHRRSLRLRCRRGTLPGVRGGRGVSTDRVSGNEQLESIPTGKHPSFLHVARRPKVNTVRYTSVLSSTTTVVRKKKHKMRHNTF